MDLGSARALPVTVHLRQIVLAKQVHVFFIHCVLKFTILQHRSVVLVMGFFLAHKSLINNLIKRLLKKMLFRYRLGQNCQHLTF